jgi:hypothetical protein
MTTQEKKSFLAVIKEQIAKYEQYIERAEYYNGTVGICPMCTEYINAGAKEWYSPRTSCLRCPNLVYRIYNFSEGHGFPCSYRKTYPPRIREHFKDGQLDKYYLFYSFQLHFEGEKAAKEYWEKMYNFVKKTTASQIDLGENSLFTMHMIWIDNTVSAKWKKAIDESIKDFQS